MHNLFQSRLFLNRSLNEAQIKQDKYMKQAYINDHIIFTILFQARSLYLRECRFKSTHKSEDQILATRSSK
jgi:hypothetical protein